MHESLRFERKSFYLLTEINRTPRLFPPHSPNISSKKRTAAGYFGHIPYYVVNTGHCTIPGYPLQYGFYLLGACAAVSGFGFLYTVPSKPEYLKEARHPEPLLSIKDMPKLLSLPRVALQIPPDERNAIY